MKDDTVLPPRPGDVDTILRRARLRRLRTAAVGPGLAAVVAIAIAVSTAGGSLGAQQVDLADPPSPTAPATPDGLFPELLPTPLPTGSMPALLPNPDASPRSTESPETTPDPSEPAEPDEGVRPYAGELGPSVNQGAAVTCQSRVVDPTDPVPGVVRNGYCVEWGGFAPQASPSPTDPEELSLRICRVVDSTSPGLLDFPTQEEADFAIYHGRQDAEGRLTYGEQYWRFSDHVTYGPAAHTLTLPQGDCVTWTYLHNALPAGGWVFQFETKTTTFPADQRVFDMYYES